MGKSVQLAIACAWGLGCAASHAAPVATATPVPVVAFDESFTQALVGQAGAVGARLQDLLLTTPPSSRPSEAVMPPGALPEPPVSALLALGVGGAVLLRRRRRK